MTAAMHSLVLLLFRYPAPPATLTLPTLPASLDCAAAAAYTTAPVATYTNEQRVLVRTAEQLQLLLPRPGHSVPAVLLQLLTPELMTAAMHSPVLLLLRLPCSACYAYTAYITSNTRLCRCCRLYFCSGCYYTNGATGACENSGTISGTVAPTWTLCAGGSITVTYTGVDDCGNALTGSATITVTLLRCYSYTAYITSNARLCRCCRLYFCSCCYLY